MLAKCFLASGDDVRGDLLSLGVEGGVGKISVPAKISFRDDVGSFLGEDTGVFLGDDIGVFLGKNRGGLLNKKYDNIPLGRDNLSELMTKKTQ